MTPEDEALLHILQQTLREMGDMVSAFIDATGICPMMPQVAMVGILDMRDPINSQLRHGAAPYVAI